MALKLAERPTGTPGHNDRDDEIAELEKMYNAPSAWEGDIPNSTADLPPDMQADHSTPHNMSQPVNSCACAVHSFL